MTRSPRAELSIAWRPTAPTAGPLHGASREGQTLPRVEPPCASGGLSPTARPAVQFLAQKAAAQGVPLLRYPSRSHGLDKTTARSAQKFPHRAIGSTRKPNSPAGLFFRLGSQMSNLSPSGARPTIGPAPLSRGVEPGRHLLSPAPSAAALRRKIQEITTNIHSSDFTASARERPATTPALTSGLSLVRLTAPAATPSLAALTPSEAYQWVGSCSKPQAVRKCDK